MVIAGIDEAGYGPLLGPLVVGCSAFEVEGEAGNELPCLWKRLGKLVSRNRSRSGRKIHVNDSKAVYHPGIGLKELERAVLAMLDCMAEAPERLEGFLSEVASEAVTEMGQAPWYAPGTGERFPIENDGLAVKLFAGALKAQMERGGAKLVHLRARVVFEKRYNRMLAATRNKGSVLFSTAACHLDELVKRFSGRGLVIVCDRQGGRTHYRQPLQELFEGWEMEVVGEADAGSEYRLKRGGDGVRIIFREKAEAGCMAVALASMLSKYCREALMGRFNAWWSARLPGIAPTAGYYTDGVRFLGEIAAKKMELGVRDEELVRAG